MSSFFDRPPIQDDSDPFGRMCPPAGLSRADRLEEERELARDERDRLVEHGPAVRFGWPG